MSKNISEKLCFDILCLSRNALLKFHAYTTEKKQNNQNNIAYTKGKST